MAAVWRAARFYAPLAAWAHADVGCEAQTMGSPDRCRWRHVRRRLANSAQGRTVHMPARIAQWTGKVSPPHEHKFTLLATATPFCRFQAVCLGRARASCRRFRWPAWIVPGHLAGVRQAGAAAGVQPPGTLLS
eukprot:76122-Chlamydomonas_euryale.AAC.1